MLDAATQAAILEKETDMLMRFFDALRIGRLIYRWRWQIAEFLITIYLAWVTYQLISLMLPERN